MNWDWTKPRPYDWERSDADNFARCLTVDPRLAAGLADDVLSSTRQPRVDLVSDRMGGFTLRSVANRKKG